MKRDVKFKIMYEKEFYKKYILFDGVIFVGISQDAKQFLSSNDSMDKFIWSFNQFDWVNRPEIFSKVKIVFEQSTRDVSIYNSGNAELIYTPLGFQSDRKNKKETDPEFDIVFNATLDRSRRATAKYHRRDVLIKLLDSGLRVLNYNGRANRKVENELIKPLNSYRNFKVIPRFGEPSHYSHGRYALNLPFHELGSKESINADWGMTRDDLENVNWLIHWDTFRCLGAKANIITFDCKETRALGFNSDNCHFFRSDTTALDEMCREIIEIVKNGQIKTISDEVWHANTYQTRWNFIIDKICKMIGLL